MASEETPGGGDPGGSLLLNQPVVIDAGTASLKAGFAGSAKPKVSQSLDMVSVMLPVAHIVCARL